MDQLEKIQIFTKVVNTVTGVWVCELQKTAKKNIQNLQKNIKKSFYNKTGLPKNRNINKRFSTVTIKV